MEWELYASYDEDNYFIEANDIQWDLCTVFSFSLYKQAFEDPHLDLCTYVV